MGKLAPHIFEFGPFRLDSVERLLLCQGQPIPLPPKVFETLLVLLQRSGHVVEKDEFMKLVWSDSFVEESNLSQNIFMLRKILGKSTEDGQYIETVPKRGYRFISTVIVPREQIAQSEMDQPISAPFSAEDEEAPAKNKPITSLAVLPLFNVSADPNTEYQSDGITETIVNSLSRLSGLHVIACSVVFRYKGQEVSPQEVGRALSVEAVVVGRMLMLNERLTIRIEMVEVANGWLLWGEQYIRKLSDIFQIQEDIIWNIMENLHLRLRGREQTHLFKHYTENVEAYQLYLKGRYFLNRRSKEDYKKAIEFFQQAINIDESYALAYSGLADSYISFDFYGLKSPRETVPTARAAAERAVELDDMLAEAHTSLACIKMIYDQDPVGAEREFKRALDLNPRYPQAHNGYSHCLLELGRTKKSFIESKRAMDLDPLDLDINLYMGWHYLYAAKHKQAIEQLQKTLELGSNFYRARLLLGMAYRQNGEIPAAIMEFERARLLEDTPVLSGFLGHAYALAGKKGEALKLLTEMQEQAKRTYVPPFSIALIYTGLGQYNEAFEWLTKAFVEQSHWRGWLKIIPEFDTLRSDPRFAALLRRVTLQK